MPTTQVKIDTSNFKFVEIKDQYILGIAVRTDSSGKYINFFSQEADLISYVDVSRVGFELPAVEIIFTFSDRKLLPYLSEKNIFVVSIGKDLDSQVQSTFNIITSDINQKAEGKWAARIVGIYDRISYAKIPKKKVYANYSSEIAKQILQESLGRPIKSNTEVRSKDSMFWLQSRISNYAFLYHLWLHSYTPNSIWLTAIDFEGQPRITDLRKQAKIQPKIMLTTGSTRSSNTYPILENFDVINNSSISNNFGGYDKTRPIYNLDDAKKSTIQKKEAVLLSESDVFNKNSNIETEASYALQNSNVHANYQIAPLNNKSMFLSLKAFQLDVTCEGEFVPVNLLDYIVMKDVQPNGQAQEDYSGIYMVGKIAHQIANKRIYTHITLWREAQNVIASPTIADKAKVPESKIDNLLSKIDNSTELMNIDSYIDIMAQYNNINPEIAKFESKIEDALSDTAVYKAYKELDKKYRQLRSYISEVYGVSSILSSIFPFMEDISSQINKITAQTPIDEIRSAVRGYLNIQSYMGELDSKIVDKINSNAVYSKYLDAKGEYNKMTSSIRALQGLGIIGDLDEYIESNE